MGFMKDAIVLNRDRAPHYNPEHPTAVISIYTPGDNPPVFPIDANIFPRVLFLCFSDVNRSQHTKIKGEHVALGKLFGKEEAGLILNFVNGCLTDGIVDFMVHCDAGISRSPGVALALREIYMHERDIPGRWSLYNKTVYYEIMMAYNDMVYTGTWPQNVVPPITGLIF